MRYNPFAYLHSEKDILKLVNTIIANTKGDGEKSTEDFGVRSEQLFYTALTGYIWYEAPEDDAEFQSPVGEMFARLAEKEPEHSPSGSIKNSCFPLAKLVPLSLFPAGQG